ncbi:unnamed protein product, partial [Phaeothamnion confervicola]
MMTPLFWLTCRTELSLVVCRCVSVAPRSSGSPAARAVSCSTDRQGKFITFSGSMIPSLTRSVVWCVRLRAMLIHIVRPVIRRIDQAGGIQAQSAEAGTRGARVVVTGHRQSLQ